MIGKKWLEAQNLDWRTKAIESKKQFRFGNNAITPSLGKITIALKPVSEKHKPIKECFTQGDVIDCGIPMLIWRPALEAMSEQIDFAKNTINATLFQQKLTTKPSGQIRLDLTEKPKVVENNTKEDKNLPKVTG